MLLQNLQRYFKTGRRAGTQLRGDDEDISHIYGRRTHQDSRKDEADSLDRIFLLTKIYILSKNTKEKEKTA